MALRKRGARPRQAQQVRVCIAASDFGFCREVAVAGGGIAVLPTLVAERDVAAGALVPVLGDYVLFEAAAYLVYPASRYLPPRVRVFRDFMLASFAKRKGRPPIL